MRGRIRISGDKSISHRAAIIAALADGRTRISNFSTSEDCASTLRCLAQLGVTIKRDGGNDVLIDGVGTRRFRKTSEAPLDCGNSGSTMRLLAGVLAAQDFTSTLTGDASLRARPMRRIIEPLELMGARLASNHGCAPLQINGRKPLTPIRYQPAVASAQVKSCLLFAGLGADGRTEISENAITRDHTERLLQWCGVPVQTQEMHDARQADSVRKTVSIEGPAHLSACDIVVPGDISSATFFIAAATLLPDSDLVIEEVCLNQTRTQILKTLMALNGDININQLQEANNEPSGDLHIKGRHTLTPLSSEANLLRGALIPQLIDELPMLAVLGTQIEGGIEIHDAMELRVKETDRIAATVANLRAMGAQVTEYDDGLAVHGCTHLYGAQLDSFNDHRIAMAFTVAALVAQGESEIKGAECVRISFPEFFQKLEQVIER
jgi:3-phosphoshikimate 1-carboxyvinyltransferase